MSGRKFDQEKVRTDLIPPKAMWGLAAILKHGSKKYGDRNWESGIDFSRLYGAAMRHMLQFWGGEDLDPESGMPHIDHAMCNLAMLSEFYRGARHDLDDRPCVEAVRRALFEQELGDEQATEAGDCEGNEEEG